MWDEEFSDLLKNLAFYNKEKSQAYGRNLCWMICTSIHSYREKKMGVGGKGGVVQSKVANYSGKVSKILSKGQGLPFIGNICTIICKIASVYHEEEESFVIEKIVNSTSQYFSEQQLTKGVIEAVTILLTDDDHLEILEMKI